MNMDQTLADLTYYLGYEPDGDVVADAADWQQSHPGSSLAEWVDAMAEIGLL
mgnify:CR=1 FL=1